MNQKSAVQSPKNEIGAASAVQPVVEKQEPVTAKAEPSETSQHVATNAALKKVAAKSKVAKKPVAELPAKKEGAEKSAPTPKAQAKPVKKTAGEGKEKAAEAEKADKATKAKKQPPKKPKMVRDSFTIPESDYALFATLKQRALAVGVEVKKGELLRASLVLLAKLTDAELVEAIGRVERLKTGRPKK